jgi:gas vesicle protein
VKEQSSEVKESIELWKDDMQKKGATINEASLKAEILQSGTTSVLQCL